LKAGTVNVTIRQVGEGDLLDLTDMFARCSSQTIYRRFHGYVRTFPEPYFSDAMKGDPRHFTLVAETPGRIVALASRVTLDHPLAGGAGGRPPASQQSTCEVGILIEDDYQRKRIGTRLLDTLLTHAGTRTVRATIQHDQSWIVPMLRRYENIRIIYS
jgi:GNAT superfamily N-acetyltransferase